MLMIEASKLVINVLNDRELNVISEQEMGSKIIELLNNREVYIALYKGDDPKSWYKAMSVWKKNKYDTVFNKWKNEK